MLESWQSMYSDSAWLPAALTAVHLVALLLGGGLAIAADRMTLRSARSYEARHQHLAELATVHRPVMVAIGALFASGMLMAAADLETYIASPVYWAKLALVGLLLLNGLGMTRAERSLARSAPGDLAIASLWGRLRTHALASLLLWTLVTIAGVLLVNFA